MVIEHTRTQAVQKPWGSHDLRPWSEIHTDSLIGEIWFQRADPGAPAPALLLKLLFTQEPLSIQVHPTDAYAHSIGLPNGKSEAWYILSAAPDAQIAVGLKRQVTEAELRAAIQNGSIVDLVQWRPARKNDIIYIPAGTIHAIGPGLVLAEIQQRSDATFRLFDHGRQRELHLDNAVASAQAGPAEWQTVPTWLADSRALLVACPHFVLERIDLSPKSNWAMHATHETWLFVLDGHARVGLMNLFAGEAVFLDAARTRINAGPSGLKGLLAYAAPGPIPSLLHNLDGQTMGALTPHYGRPSERHRTRPVSLFPMPKGQS